MKKVLDKYISICYIIITKRKEKEISKMIKYTIKRQVSIGFGGQEIVRYNIYDKNGFLVDTKAETEEEAKERIKKYGK